jgi:hypothetical protein
MASQDQVRSFLAHWFQLGKPIILSAGSGEWLPSPVYYRGDYSQSFEDCWQRIMATGGEGCYLKGTNTTLAEMISPGWDVTACARCSMPVAIPSLGQATSPCPCHDLHTWPNYDVPTPRVAVDDGHHLADIQRRLRALQAETSERQGDPGELLRRSRN